MMPVPPNPYIIALIALAGTVIGGAISFGTQAWLRFYERKQERQSLALAFAAEIEGYLKIVERRKQAQSAETLLQQALAGQPTSLRGFLSQNDTQMEAFPIASANVGKIGLLGLMSGEVVQFYTLAKAVRATGIDANAGRYDSYTPAQMASLIEEELAVWRMANVLGNRLVKMLRDC
ncbi:hypothetical protein [Mesorhizobium sp.]|uniref:hypothetical protein n=1 Tax=Mesorhizobium sp. TaxID=1871066 RepID=UPI000FE51A2F|nr:hypothetical protein [Mesorhizobium sp.]RWF64129.1 MAG: hypothetical protein EOS47_16295 [Mesorhizobium sp.]